MHALAPVTGRRPKTLNESGHSQGRRRIAGFQPEEPNGVLVKFLRKLERSLTFVLVVVPLMTLSAHEKREANVGFSTRATG